MAFAWLNGHEPERSLVDGLTWRWWTRERTVRVRQDVLAAAVETLGEVADVIDGEPVPASAATEAAAVLRRVATDLGGGVDE